MQRIPIVAVVGPTASGKTALAVELALRLNGEVISADSMQIYRGMDIATAKPAPEEMRGVPHHLIGCVEPTEAFSVARWCELARGIIRDISERGKLPIVAGGTGLYVDSLLGNLQFAEAEADPAARASLQAELDENGLDWMLDRLSEVDPPSAERLAKERNPKRILRALEIYRTTGLTMTGLNEAQSAAPSPYDAVKIGLSAEDRGCLYDRINRRVDRMLDDGLLDEAERFYAAQRGETAAAAIGYKELLPYLCGEQPLDSCVESLKRATRRYAKRQLTWFRRDADIHWFPIDRIPFDAIADEAEQLIKDHFYDAQKDSCQNA